MSAPLSPDYARFHDGEAEAFRPGRLWSLLDMLPLNARAFYRATNALQRMETMLAERSSVRQHSNGGASIEFIDDQVLISVLDEALSDLRTELVVMSCQLTLMEVDRFFVKLHSLTFEAIKRHSEQIRSRLADELDLTKLLIVEKRHIEYFEPKLSLYGDQFAMKYISASFDLS